jgi:hypothetical protein
MFKNIILLVWLILPSISFGQAKLEKLVGEMDRMHAEWKASESKKSGIFGKRTKKDMIETHEWMSRIIQKDNQIMDELRLLGEIEKTEITYEKNDYKFISQKQEREIALLKRALQEKDELTQVKIADKRAYEWTTLIFFLGTVTFAYLFYKQKKILKAV